MNTQKLKDISEKTKQNKWIRLADEKPEHDKLCWVFIPTKLFGSGISIGRYIGKRFCDIYGYVWGEKETVSHWKLLDTPEPPMHETLSEIVENINLEKRTKYKEYYERKKLTHMRRTEKETDGSKLAESEGRAT